MPTNSGLYKHPWNWPYTDFVSYTRTKASERVLSAPNSVFRIIVKLWTLNMKKTQQWMSYGCTMLESPHHSHTNWDMDVSWQKMMQKRPIFSIFQGRHYTPHMCFRYNKWSKQSACCLRRFAAGIISRLFEDLGHSRIFNFIWEYPGLSILVQFLRIFPVAVRVPTHASWAV